MDNAIQIIYIFKSEAEDIQLGKDLEEEVELTPAILHQNNHNTKNLDANINADKAKVKDNDLAWVEDQYLTSNSSVFKAFLTNLVDLPVKTTNSSKSKRRNCSYKKLFIATTIKKEPRYCFLKSAVMTQLEK